MNNDLEPIQKFAVGVVWDLAMVALVVAALCVAWTVSGAALAVWLEAR